MNNNFLIVFEGIDRSGKTSLMSAFNKLTGYAHPCVDRLYASHAFYAYDRTNNISNLMDLVYKHGATICDSDITYINVNVTCDKESWEKRMDDTKHEDVNWSDSIRLRQVSVSLSNHANEDREIMHIVDIDTSIFHQRNALQFY